MSNEFWQGIIYGTVLSLVLWSLLYATLVWFWT